MENNLSDNAQKIMDLSDTKKMVKISIRILKIDKRYGSANIRIISSMKKYEGKKAKITLLDKSDGSYRLNIDSEAHWWADDMLTLVKAREAE